VTSLAQQLKSASATGRRRSEDDLTAPYQEEGTALTEDFKSKGNLRMIRSVVRS
jgi:hypothetical protein